MDPYYTQSGSRTDLAQIEAVKPEGYIADQVFPVVPVAEKAGSVAYATIVADAAAQTGRSAGVAPTSTQLANSATTYSAAEIIKRYSITPDEVKQMGGIENADMVGAKASKRSVFTAIEEAVAAATLGVAVSATFDPAKVQTEVQDAVDAIEQYEGVLTLVTSTKTVKAMIQAMLADNTVGPALARIVSGASPQVSMTGLNFKAWLDALAMLFGVDKVLLGTSRIWNASAIRGRFALAKLDDGMDPLSHKYLPVLGKRFQFLQDGTNPFSIETYANRDTHNNNYDASVWQEIKTLNSGALYVFSGVQDA